MQGARPLITLESCCPPVKAIVVSLIFTDSSLSRPRLVNEVLDRLFSSLAYLRISYRDAIISSKSLYLPFIH
jgi:hypothetical protein